MLEDIRSRLSKIFVFDRKTVVRLVLSLLFGLPAIVYFAINFTGAVFGILLFVVLSCVSIRPSGRYNFVLDLIVPVYTALFTCYYFQLALIYGHEWFGNPGIFSVHLLFDGRLFFEMPVIIAIYYLLRAVTLSPRLSGIIAPVPFMLLALTDYYVYLFRGHEIVMEDLMSARTALAVAGDYSYPVTVPLFFIVIPYILFTISLIGVKRAPTESKREIAGHEVSISPIAKHIFYFVLAVSFLALELLGVSIWFNSSKWQGRENCHTYTAWNDNPSSLVGFYLNFVKSIEVMHVSAPEGYSAGALDAAINTAYTDYQVLRESMPQTSEGVKPNIIIVMNESYTDLGIYGKLGPATDPDPFFDSLINEENCVGGYVYTSVFGGNTPNSEFEFLTGLSLCYLPSATVPFNTVLRDTPVRSLVRYLSDHGYTSLAMHPAPSGNWNRHQVYPMLGFDESMFLEGFNYSDDDFINGWMTDSCAYRNLISRIDQQEQGEPFIDLLVTTQNHGGYGGEYTGSVIYYEADPSLGIDCARAEELNNFCSRLALSDKALEMLITDLRSRSERYILVIYGDHQPSCAPVMGSDFDRGGRAYLTPYRIWANYNINTELATANCIDVGNLTNVTSLNYLPLDLLAAANFEYDRYYAFIYSLRQMIPAVNQAGSLVYPDINEQDAQNADRLYSYYVYNTLYDSEEG